MSKTKTMTAQVVAEVAQGQRVFMGAKAAQELPEAYIMARRDYLKEQRNELRQANALSFLTAQNGFMYWFYKAIGQRESATFYITDRAVSISKGAFLTDYKRAVAIMQEVGANTICEVSFTKSGNVAVKAKAGVIAVSVN